MRRMKAKSVEFMQRNRNASRRRWMRVVVAALATFALLALSVPAVAESPFGPQTYRLSPGDRVSVMVFGQPELSGDMAIDVTGNIFIPFVGGVEVGNLTLAESRKRIIDRLADGILNQPSVNVQISELRPVFLIGDVRTAGAQAYKFGMNVKTAIAAAGGFGTLPATQGTAISDLLLSEERVRQLMLLKATLTIRRARLEAQRDGATTFVSPIAQGEGREGDLSDIVAVEKETFESQAAIQQSQVELLKAQKPRINNEIEALNAQIATRHEQLSLVKQQVDKYGRLVKQGLGLANQEMQLRLTETTYESEIWNLTGQVARLQMDLGGLDLRIQETEATFKKQTIADLRDVRDRLKELEVTLPIAREIRESKFQQAGSLAEAQTDHGITVTRNRNGQSASFKGDETTPLEPGDVVEVQFKLLGGALSTGASVLQRNPADRRTAPVRDTTSLVPPLAR